MRQKMIVIIETESRKREKFNDFFTKELVGIRPDVCVLTNSAKVQDIDLIAVLIHKGDQNYWQRIMNSTDTESLRPLERIIINRYSPENTKLFWFNSSGVKSSGDVSGCHNNICISKKMSLSEIELTAKDIDEIIKFSTRERIVLPTCCYDPLPLQRLIALSILCQAYLVKLQSLSEEDFKSLNFQKSSWWFNVLLSQQELEQYSTDNDRKKMIENSLSEYDLIDTAIRMLLDSIESQNATDLIVRNAHNSITNIIQSG
jgi:hypothetical protein